MPQTSSNKCKKQLIFLTTQAGPCTMAERNWPLWTGQPQEYTTEIAWFAWTSVITVHFYLTFSVQL